MHYPEIRPKSQLFAACAFAVLTTLTSLTTGCGSGSGKTYAPPIAASTLSRAVSTTRTNYQLPALTAAVIDSRDIVPDAVGVRKLGTATPVTKEDHFHIGSNVKAMTATLAATFVEEGKIAWNTKILDIFPKMAGTTRAEYQNATLEQLLQHRTGLPGYEELADILVLPPFSGDIIAQRRAFAAYVLQQAPVVAPGEFQYSNAGYTVAAAMLEKISGKSWEALLQERVLRPLGITSAGFGWPATNNSQQPNGHVEGDDGTLTPHDEQNLAEQFPVLFSPAGNLYLSVKDFARFVQTHLRGLQGQRDLLKPETIQRLHTPTGDYADGWQILDVNGVRSSVHNGSADTFFSLAVLQPSRNRAVVMMTNAGGQKASDGLEALAGQLLTP